MSLSDWRGQTAQQIWVGQHLGLEHELLAKPLALLPETIDTLKPTLCSCSIYKDHSFPALVWSYLREGQVWKWVSADFSAQRSVNNTALDKPTCSDSVTRWLLMLDTAGKLRLPMLPKQMANKAIGLLNTKMSMVCCTTLANSPARKEKGCPLLLRFRCYLQRGHDGLGRDTEGPSRFCQAGLHSCRQSSYTNSKDWRHFFLPLVCQPCISAANLSIDRGAHQQAAGLVCLCSAAAIVAVWAAWTSHKGLPVQTCAIDPWC